MKTVWKACHAQIHEISILWSTPTVLYTLDFFSHVLHVKKWLRINFSPQNFCIDNNNFSASWTWILKMTRLQNVQWLFKEVFSPLFSRPRHQLLDCHELSQVWQIPFLKLKEVFWIIRFFANVTIWRHWKRFIWLVRLNQMRNSLKTCRDVSAKKSEFCKHVHYIPTFFNWIMIHLAAAVIFNVPNSQHQLFIRIPSPEQIFVFFWKWIFRQNFFINAFKWYYFSIFNLNMNEGKNKYLVHFILSCISFLSFWIQL